MEQILDPTRTYSKDVTASTTTTTTQPVEAPVLFEMVVQQKPDAPTSLGRMTSHVSMELRPKESVLAKEDPTEPNYSNAKPEPLDPVESMTFHSTSNESSANEMNELSYWPSDPVHDVIAEMESTSIGETIRDPGIYISIQVPEKVNLVCQLDDNSNHNDDESLSSITVTDKIEGDVHLRVHHGDIYVQKLRGHTVQLEAAGAGSSIHVAGVLEAQQVRVETQGRIRAKQIHGRDVSLIVHHNNNMRQQQKARHESKAIKDEDDEGSLVDVSALFVSNNGVASVQINSDAKQPLSRRAVRIKSHHGFLAVATNKTRQPVETNPLTEQRYPLVELGGVNGSCEVTVENVVADDDDNCHQDWSSTLVHIDSLSPESVSFVTADRGNIAMTIDRKAEADLRLLSTTSDQQLTGAVVPWTEIGPVLVEDDRHDNLLTNLRERYETTTIPTSGNEVNDETGIARISIQTKAFTGRPSSFTVGSDVSYVDGWVENKSQEPDSRYERKVQGGAAVGAGSVGKIRLDGAAHQALDSFSTASSSSREGTDGNENNTELAVRPLLAVAGTQMITVETVSWLGAIARRYGLQEEARKGLAGRTASRRGRPILSADNE